jgi:hypothetical protein
MRAISWGAGIPLKVCLQGFAAVAVTALAGYVLTSASFRAPPQALQQSQVSQNEMTSRDERALTREILKARREAGKEAPAEVVLYELVALASPPSSPGWPNEGARDRNAAIRTGTPFAVPRSQVRGSTDAASARLLGTIDVSAPAPQSAPAHATAPQDETAPQRPRQKPQHATGERMFNAFSHLVGAVANATGETLSFVLEVFSPPPAEKPQPQPRRLRV